MKIPMWGKFGPDDPYERGEFWLGSYIWGWSIISEGYDSCFKTYGFNEGPEPYYFIHIMTRISAAKLIFIGWN